jgi:hypothetical protein
VVTICYRNHLWWIQYNPNRPLLTPVVTFRVSATNNNGVWIGWLDLLVLLWHLHLITITCNSSQSVTA